MQGYNINKVIESAKLVAHNKILTFQEVSVCFYFSHIRHYVFQIRDDVYSDLVNAEQVAGVKVNTYIPFIV